MNIHDATEFAYKNGYKDGVKEFAERLKNHFWSKADCDVLIRGVLDNLLTELTERKEDEGK